MTGAEIGKFIIENKIDIIKDITLGVIFLLIPILIAKLRRKDGSRSLHNNTPILEVKVIVQQILIKVYPPGDNEQTTPSKPITKTNSSNDPFIYWGLGALLGVFLYQKYHSEIMDWLLIYTILSLISTSLLIILLYRNNQLDRYNQLWCGMMIYLIIINFISIALMSQQAVNVQGDISLWLKVLYYVEGFVFVAFLNISIIVVQAHLFAVNAFLARQGKISGFIIHKTHFMLNKPIGAIIFIVVLSLVALLFVSGKAFDLIGQGLHGK